MQQRHWTGNGWGVTEAGSLFWVWFLRCEINRKARWFYVKWIYFILFYFLRSSPPFHHPCAGIFSFSTAYSVFMESPAGRHWDLVFDVAIQCFWLASFLFTACKTGGVSGPFLHLNFNYDPIRLPFFPYTTVAFHSASSVFRLAGPWTDGADGVMTDV